MVTNLLWEVWRLCRQQWYSEEEIEAIRLKKLKRQLWRAYKYSEFYKKRFDAAGFHPADLKSVDDLQALPVMAKTEYMDAGRRSLCEDIDIDQCLWLSSSGSTGLQTKLPFTKADRHHRILKELRLLFAHGYKPTDKMAIMRMPTDMIVKTPALQNLGLFRREYVSIFDKEEVQLAALKHIRPDIIYGYASAFRALAELLESGAYDIPKPKILLTSADMLNSYMRELITQQFAAEPIDLYGAIEIGWIAWQCPERQGYHINSDCVILECLRDGKPVKPGEEGELVVTNLHSDAAPLIRYSMGDSGILDGSRCACGRTLPILKCLKGRYYDFVTLRDGRKVSPSNVSCEMLHVKGMKWFQVVQESLDEFTVKVLTHPGAPDASATTQALRRVLDAPVEVKVEYVQDIPHESTGKYRMVKSLVTSSITKKLEEKSN